MKIAGLQKVSLLDYPGHLAASVFIAGCNLNCGYCQNRWMIDATGVEPAMAVPALLAWLRGRLGLIDGVCLSGGEPTIHTELAGLMRSIGELGLLVKLDTNGTRPEMLGALVDEGLADYVAMDIKAPLDARYARMAGVAVDVSKLSASMRALRAWDGTAQKYEFRTTAGPGLSGDDLRDVADVVLARELWALQVYVPPRDAPRAADGPPALSGDELTGIAGELRCRLPRLVVRGA